MIFLVIIFYITVFIIEVIPLIKNNMKKEIYLFSTLLVFAFIFSLLISLGVNIPSPAEPIKKIVFAIIGK